MWLLMRALAALIVTVDVASMIACAIAGDIVGFTLATALTGVGIWTWIWTREDYQRMGPPAKYRALAIRLRWEIQNEGWQPGDKLGTLAELAERFGTTRTTIHRAVKHLVDDSIIEVRRNHGIFVAGGTPSRTVQVENDLRRQAALKQPIGTAEAIALSWTVSPSTVRRILAKLRQEGVIPRRPDRTP